MYRSYQCRPRRCSWSAFRLSDLYSCEFGFVCRLWILPSPFECEYVAYNLFFSFSEIKLCFAVRAQWLTAACFDRQSHCPGTMPIFTCCKLCRPKALPGLKDSVATSSVLLSSDPRSTCTNDGACRRNEHLKEQEDLRPARWRACVRQGWHEKTSTFRLLLEVSVVFCTKRAFYTRNAFSELQFKWPAKMGQSTCEGGGLLTCPFFACWASSL